VTLIDKTLPEALLPPIRVDVIATDAETRAALETLRRDPATARQKWTQIEGGLAEALNRYKTHPSPDLILFQSDEAPEKLLQEIAALSQACDRQTRAIVIGRANDVGLFRLLQKAGVSDYLTRPIAPAQVAEAIRSSFNDKSMVRQGRITACLGLTGGAGSSTVAQNLAVTLAMRGARPVMLADLDLQGGTVRLNFDDQGLAGMNELIRQADRVDGTLLERLAIRRGDRLNLLTCAPDLGQDPDLPGAMLDHLCGLAMHSAYHLVLDLPRRVTPQIRDVLRLADDVVLTVSPDLAGLRNLRLALDHLSQTRPQQEAPVVVLNQKGMPGRTEVPVADFARDAGETRLRVLPFDPRSFSDAVAKGKPVVELGRKAVNQRFFQALARDLGGALAPAQAQPFATRLSKALRRWW
jgi:pilus assembly protein CpaE